jgi:uncharacterized protein (DUF362 family)
MKRRAFFLLAVWWAATWAQAQIPTARAVRFSEVFYALETRAVGPARTINPGAVRRMVDSLVCGVTGQRTVTAAWRSLVQPSDRVGVKVSASGRGVSGTNPEVVEAICAGLIEAGVPAKNLIVWDRNLEDLLAAGFRRDSRFYTLEAIDPKTGYDPKVQVSAPVIGRLIWGDAKFGDKKISRFSDLLTPADQLSSTSFFSRILNTGVTKVINVPSLTDSFSTGIHGALAGMTLGNLDNWRRFAKSAADGDSHIAEIYADPLIQEKVVLTILDGLIMQYAGGPFPDPNFLVENFTLFASTDAVAIDATAARLIEETRRAGKMPSIKTMTAYIEAASLLGLGEFAESRITRTRVGVEGIR